MTISVLNGIQALALSWQNTKIPLYSGLIELKKYEELDTIFNKTTKQMIGISFVMNFLAIIFVVLLKFFDISISGRLLSERFIQIPAFILMSIAVCMNQLIYSWATYLRCHKKEPFLALSVVEGLLCMVSTLVFGRYYGLYGIVVGYCFIIVFQVIWAKLIFNRKKNVWHNGK